jgi:hypothetical protein
LRTVGYTAAAAVVGDAIVIAAGAVDDYSAVINVGDAGDVDAVDGAVVVEVMSSPIAAVIPGTGIAEAIRNAAIEAYVLAPVAAMEEIAATIETPVGRSPERSVVGRGAPYPGDPIVACGGPAPIAGGPEIVGRGSFGLLIFW